MENTKHVKLNSGWKDLDLPPDLLSDAAFESLISCKVMTDYEIVDPNRTKKRRLKENKKSPKASDTKKQMKLEMRKKVKKEKSSSNKIVSLNTINKVDVSSDLLKSDIKEVTVRKKQKTRSNCKSGSWTVSSQTTKSGVKNTELATQKLETNKSQIKGRSVTTKGDKSDKARSSHDVENTAKKRKKENAEKTVQNYSSERKKRRMMGESEGDETNSLQNDMLNEKMAAWKNLFVPKKVLQALCENEFFSPTPIQAMALPSAIRDKKDIVGAAETGSGKTLAFGIPVIHNILSHKEKEEKNSSSTDEDDDDGGEDDDDDGKDKEEVEELLEDVSPDEIVQDDEEVEQMEELGCVKVINDADFSELGFPNSGPAMKKHNKYPLALVLQPTRELAVQVKDHLQVAAAHTDITIAPILGGMSSEKQKRILKKCPDILVATPGRLWELMEQVPYLSRIDEVDSLVIDEADRMIEKGHFEELTQILAYINRNGKKKNRRQTFVFSATLTLVHVGPQRSVRKKMTVTEEKKLETLMNRIQMREKPKVIDLTRKIGTVETLTEARINCTLEEKDLYLYYFLTQYPGRTLVFANSKDCIRRLISIFTLLQTNPLPLHADMHQKQRLKNLERFTANDKAVLLASDVAARGLDIPNVEHVIHYQVPQTVENYVHRSGRTARAMKEGLSVVLISPEDVKNYRKIVHTLNKSEDLPVFPVELHLLSALRKRLNLAKKIDTEEHRFNKKKRENEWFEKAAKEMDILIDDEELLTDLGDSFELSGRKQDLNGLKNELEQMLKQKLAPHSFTGKYLTQSGKLELPAKDEKKDALKVVKKDGKLQHELVQSSPSSSRNLNRKKKSKWKKKN